MKNIVWKNILKAAAILATFLLVCFLIFRECKPSPRIPSIQPEIEKVDSLDREFERLKDSANLVRLKDDTIRELRARLSVTSASLTTATKEVSRLIARGNEVKPDTALYVANCDSLAREVESLMDFALSAQEQCDSLFNVYDRHSRERTAALERTQELYSQLRQSFQVVVDNNGQLELALRKETSRRKLDRTLVRILGTATLVVGGMYLTK